MALSAACADSIFNSIFDHVFPLAWCQNKAWVLANYQKRLLGRAHIETQADAGQGRETLHGKYCVT